MPRSLAIMPPSWSSGLSPRDFTPTMSKVQSEDANVRPRVTTHSTERPTVGSVHFIAKRFPVSNSFRSWR